LQDKERGGEEKMKKYERAEIEVIVIENEDIITSSNELPIDPA